MQYVDGIHGPKLKKPLPTIRSPKTFEAQLWRHPLREWCPSLEIVFKGILPIDDLLLS